MKEFIIKYWLQALFTGIISVIGLYVRKQLKTIKQFISDIECDRQEQQTIKRALLSILRDRLLSECKRILKKGKITTDELDNISNLYLEYHDEFGGNGRIQTLYERCIDLTIQNDNYTGEKNENKN